MPPITATRIYQARINMKNSHFVGEAPNDTTISQALADTHALFQEAVNYHLVALAGLVGNNPPKDSIAEHFSSRIREIWEEKPKGQPLACTLQQSIARSLNLTNPSFDEAVADIFADSPYPAALPLVFDSIVAATEKGEGAIQKEGRSILPRLCFKAYKGNFDFSKKSLYHALQKRLLQELLIKERSETNLKDLHDFAEKMSLGDTKIKLNGKSLGSKEEQETVLTALEELKKIDKLSGKYEEGLASYYNNENYKEQFLSDIDSFIHKIKTAFTPRQLECNNKCSAALKNLTLFFMYFPCKLSADLLQIVLEKIDESDIETHFSNYQYEGEDATIQARSKRGYVYLGFSALANWETKSHIMYSKEWDILAFKEALKTLHSYELKTKERKKELEEYEKQIRGILHGNPQASADDEDEENESFFALTEDARYALVCELLQELGESLNEEDFEVSTDGEAYSLSSRTLKGWNSLKETWIKECKSGRGTESNLIARAKDLQRERGDKIGSVTLFLALAQEKYHAIWLDLKQEKNHTADILFTLVNLHNLKRKAEQFKRPVRITAADPHFSPRLIQLKDLENLAKVEIIDKKGKATNTLRKIYAPTKANVLQLGLMARNPKGRWQAYPVDLHYAAPRADRDELDMRDTTQAVTQQILRPLIKDKETLMELKKPAAVTLSIKSLNNELTPSAWLNFAVTLDVTKLQDQLGKSKCWQGQFNGANKEYLHLHWPSTYGSKKIAPWWNNKQICQQGITVLSVDLGLRYAAAWGLLHIEKGQSSENHRLIGQSGAPPHDQWYGKPIKSGIIRLDGEGKNANRNQSSIQQAAGVRMADADEKQQALTLLQDKIKLITWWKKENAVSILDVQQSLLDGFKRYLSRYRFFSNKLRRLSDDNKEEWSKVCQEIKDYMTYGNSLSSVYRDFLQAVEEGKLSRAVSEFKKDIWAMHHGLPRLAENVINMVLPRKKDSWKWIEYSRKGYIGSGIMTLDGKAPEASKKTKIWHSGGISIRYIEQLQGLRQCLQSMNRMLATPPGERGIQGRAAYEQLVIDPCPLLLEKIDNMRENRCNQIAGAIAAQALGVRLIPSRDGKNSGIDITHGEYERIPGREVVDFVVLEDLSRYKMNIDRSRGENSSLMNWSHRSIVAKVKQIVEELYGIPVLTTTPSYTSKFDCMSSEAGFRAMPLSPRAHKEASDKPKMKSEDRTIRRFYESLLYQMQERGCDVSKIQLFAPQQGGEYFISAGKDICSPRNADINAAINIGWRAVAAPDSFALLHRLRIEKNKKDCITLRETLPNAREKALSASGFHHLDSLVIETSFSNLFFTPHLKQKDAPQYKSMSQNCAFIHGKELWGYIKSISWKRCHELNYRNLKEKGFHDDAELIKRRWL